MCKWQVSALLRLTSKIGSFRRFGCSAVRGTKTALAVLAMLASVLAWGSAPVRADDNDGHLGKHEVRVLTQNMFIGAPLGPIVQATSLPAFLAAINALPGIIQTTKPAERAAAMAAEIATQRPDFVALHEVWKLTVEGVVVEDLLQYVLDALKALGQPYDLVHDAVHDAVVNEEDLDLTQLPPQIRKNFHLTDRDAILMRTDGDIEIMDGGVQPILFDTPINSPLPPPFNFAFHSGYVSVDATVRGIPLRFVSVHLVPNKDTIEAHTLELLDKTASPTLPLVFGGDFNTTADDPSNESYALVYQHLIDAGLTDAWNPLRPGLTCCQDSNLLNKRSNLDLAPCPPVSCPHRIDLILFRGAFAVEDINLIGNKPSDRTPSGLWPSDHAGIVATLAGPESQQFVADK
jgi:endonuclease/exonuclease/phosphatase family metal-dependent hydrolase